MTFTPVGTQIDVIELTAAVTVVLGGAGTGKGTTAAAVAAALIRADDASRNALRRTMKIDRAASPMPPRARVLLLSFTAVTAVVTAVQVESVNVEPQAVAFGLRTPTSRSNRSQRRCYPAWHGIGSRFGDTPSPGANRSRGHNARGRTNVMKHHT